MAYRIFNSLNQPITLDFGSYDLRVEPFSEVLLSQAEFETEEYKKNSADLHLLEGSAISNDVIDDRVPEPLPVIEPTVEAETVTEIIEDDTKAEVVQEVSGKKKQKLIREG